MGHAISTVIGAILNLAMLLLVVTAVLSWLVAFNVINTRNPAVYQVVRTLQSMTEPLLRPIRRVVPSLGGVDLSFIVLWLIILFLQQIHIHVLHGLLVSTLG